MTQAQLDRTVATRTGESLRTVRLLGFQPDTPDSPGDRGDPAGRRLPVLRPGRALSRTISRRLARPGRVREPDLRRLLRLRRDRRVRGVNELIRFDPTCSRFTDHHSKESLTHDHAHPPPGPRPARRLPTLRSRDRPPRPDPPDRLHCRRRPSMRPTSVRASGRRARLPLAWPSTGAVALPLDALADLEGKDDSTVALDPVTPDRTVVRWTDRGIPQVREYTVPAIASLGRFVTPPASWTDLEPGLLDALAEATATAADDDTRYALSCLALRGGLRQHRRHRWPPGPDPGWLCLPLGRRRSDPAFADLRHQGAIARSGRPGRQDRRSRCAPCRPLDDLGRDQDRRPVPRRRSHPARSGFGGHPAQARSGRCPVPARFAGSPARSRRDQRTGHGRSQRPDRGPSPGGRPGWHDRAGPVPVGLHRHTGPVPDQPRVAGPSDPARAGRPGDRRRRLAAGRPRRRSNLRLAAAVEGLGAGAERRCGPHRVRAPFHHHARPLGRAARKESHRERNPQSRTAATS